MRLILKTCMSKKVSILSTLRQADSAVRVLKGHMTSLQVWSYRVHFATEANVTELNTIKCFKHFTYVTDITVTLHGQDLCF